MIFLSKIDHIFIFRNLRNSLCEMHFAKLQIASIQKVNHFFNIPNYLVVRYFRSPRYQERKASKNAGFFHFLSIYRILLNQSRIPPIVSYHFS